MIFLILKASKSCANKNINTLLPVFTFLYLSFFYFPSQDVLVPTETGCSQHVASQERKTKVIRYILSCDADVKMSGSDGKVIEYCHVFFSS